MQYDLWSYRKRLEDIDENKEEDHDSGDRGWSHIAISQEIPRTPRNCQKLRSREELSCGGLNRRLVLPTTILNLTSSEKVKVVIAQLCPTLYDPMDCRLPGSSVHGILQARILDWVAIPFSRGFS